MWNAAARGSGLLSVVRRAPQRDRALRARDGTSRAPGPDDRDRGVGPRGQRPPARVREGGPDPAARGRGRRQGDERRGRRDDAHGRSHGSGRKEVADKTVAAVKTAVTPATAPTGN